MSDHRCLCSAPAASTPSWAFDSVLRKLDTIAELPPDGRLVDDNATSTDFASLLPLTLSLDDYNGTEKISDLPKQLTTRGAAEGVDPAAGDIAYYAPWGNLAIFYKDFEYSRGVAKLGAIESGARAFERPGSLRVTIEPVEE